MLLPIWALLSIWGINSAYASNQIFDVITEGHHVSGTGTICRYGEIPSECQNYNISGDVIHVKANSTTTVTYKTAGILLKVPGYKLAGCIPYTNGYCIFAVNSFNYSRLELY